MTTTEGTSLTDTGVAVLLVYGARLMPPGPGRPGIRVTVDARGTCLLEAVGYPSNRDAQDAICEAAQTCLDADLLVSFHFRGPGNPPARMVRRRATVSAPDQGGPA